MSKPLYSFENANDYIFDAKWSPVHPAMFASVDATGRVDIWNINQDTEVSSHSRKYLISRFVMEFLALQD